MSAGSISGTYGTRNEDILVIDQEGILRLKTNAIGTGSHLAVNRQVDALVNRQPVISLSYREIFFARTLKVGESKTEKLTITNTGAGPLEITGYSAPDGITMSPSSLTIGAGESQTVEITLTPTQPGSFSGSITLEHGDQSVGTLRVSVRELTIEMAPSPSIALGRESLTLGEIEVGNRIAETFAITNTGTGPLDVTDIRSDIAGLAFSETQFTIPPGSSHDITVTFDPQAEGPIAGTIDIHSNDPENAAIRLTITGSVTAIPVPVIGLGQESLTLGEIDLGNSVTKTVTIINTGTGPLTVTDIRSYIAGLAFSETQFTIPPGSSHDITVTFDPQAEGPIAGTIDIHSNDPENAAIRLTITGSIIGPRKRSDFDNSGKIDFADFLLFARAFGTANPTFDLNNSGSVDFPDFLIFVAHFGKPVN